MSAGYRAILWTPHIRRYDLIMLAGIAAYLLAFVGVTLAKGGSEHQISTPIIIIRATGTCAILLLHVILCIGPLVRLDRRFLPVLYNRRHLGVTTFLIACVHLAVVLVWYHGFGVLSPFVSLLASNTRVTSFAAFPFELPGALAFIILFLMAATSHDYWLNTLTPRVWKTLHMLVYVAWLLLLAHVAMGALRSEPSAVYLGLVAASAVLIPSFHLLAGLKERRRDREAKADAAAQESPTAKGPWLDAASFTELEDGRGKVVCLPGMERIALFRQGDRVHALTNVCAHQGGPLGEGRIIDGCITCPWHGYQYRPHDGCSPPPFTEKVATYQVRIVGDKVQVHREALPPGTAVAPAQSPAALQAEPQAAASQHAAEAEPFYVNYLPVPAALKGFLRSTAVLLVIAMAVAGAGLASLQRDPGPGRWDVDNPSTLEGILLAQPYPVLLQQNPQGKWTVTLLVSEGKLGVPASVLKHAGQRVKLRGSVIARDARELFEVLAQEDAAEPLGAASDASHAAAYAPRALPDALQVFQGEIIDPKCYHGVMKPGEGKTHKACASLCIRGGIPPMFLPRSLKEARPVLLLNAQGQPLTGDALEPFIEYVGEPVVITGVMERWLDLDVLRVQTLKPDSAF